MKRLVIVTDLDGSLLDPLTHGFEPAVPALERVKQLGVPLVLCSSRTRAEMEGIRRRMGIDDPFIVENGGAIVAPAGYFARVPAGTTVSDERLTLALGRPYADVVAVLREVAAAERIRITGFSDMTVGEVAADADLSPLEAQLTKFRQYDEPFRLFGTDPSVRSRFLKTLRHRGLKVMSEGRYDHATGGADRGQAVVALRRVFEENGSDVMLVGLGDDLNDMSMLRAVDRAVIVKNDMCDATARLARKVPTASVTSASGPEGWAEAVGALLDTWHAGVALAPATAWRRRVSSA